MPVTELFSVIGASVWFFLPAYIANGSPPILASLPGLRRLACPLDSEKTWHGKPILGSHKTFVGTVGGVIAGTLTGMVQNLFYLYPLDLAFLLALGAIIGDLAKSFIKRRVGIASGKPFPVFDQLDFVIGAFTFAWVFNYGELSFFVTIVLLTPFLTLLSNYVAYKAGWKDVWW